MFTCLRTNVKRHFINTATCQGQRTLSVSQKKERWHYRCQQRSWDFTPGPAPLRWWIYSTVTASSDSLRASRVLRMTEIKAEMQPQRWSPNQKALYFCTG